MSYDFAQFRSLARTGLTRDFSGGLPIDSTRKAALINKMIRRQHNMGVSQTLNPKPQGGPLSIPDNMYVCIRIRAVRDPRQRVCVHVQARDCNVRGIMEAANCLGCCSGTYIKLL